ncbi:13082_t:CDS:10, partial [Entrophospora sp. SA101]
QQQQQPLYPSTLTISENNELSLPSSSLINNNNNNLVAKKYFEDPNEADHSDLEQPTDAERSTSPSVSDYSSSDDNRDTLRQMNPSSPTSSPTQQPSAFINDNSAPSSAATTAANIAPASSIATNTVSSLPIKDDGHYGDNVNLLPIPGSNGSAKHVTFNIYGAVSENVGDVEIQHTRRFHLSNVTQNYYIYNWEIKPFQPCVTQLSGKIATIILEQPLFILWTNTSIKTKIQADTVLIENQFIPNHFVPSKKYFLDTSDDSGSTIKNNSDYDFYWLKEALMEEPFNLGPANKENQDFLLKAENDIRIWPEVKGLEWIINRWKKYYEKNEDEKDIIAIKNDPTTIENNKHLVGFLIGIDEKKVMSNVKTFGNIIEYEECKDFSFQLQCKDVFDNLIMMEGEKLIWRPSNITNVWLSCGCKVKKERTSFNLYISKSNLINQQNDITIIVKYSSNHRICHCISGTTYGQCHGIIREELANVEGQPQDIRKKVLKDLDAEIRFTGNRQNIPSANVSRTIKSNANASEECNLLEKMHVAIMKANQAEHDYTGQLIKPVPPYLCMKNQDDSSKHPKIINALMTMASGTGSDAPPIDILELATNDLTASNLTRYINKLRDDEFKIYNSKAVPYLVNCGKNILVACLAAYNNETIKQYNERILKNLINNEQINPEKIVIAWCYSHCINAVKNYTRSNKFKSEEYNILKNPISRFAVKMWNKIRINATLVVIKYDTVNQLVLNPLYNPSLQKYFKSTWWNTILFWSDIIPSVKSHTRHATATVEVENNIVKNMDIKKRNLPIDQYITIRVESIKINSKPNCREIIKYTKKSDRRRNEVSTNGDPTISQKQIAQEICMESEVKIGLDQSMVSKCILV